MPSPKPAETESARANIVDTDTYDREVTKLDAVTVIVETLEQFLPETQDAILVAVNATLGRRSCG